MGGRYAGYLKSSPQRGAPRSPDRQQVCVARLRCTFCRVRICLQKTQAVMSIDDSDVFRCYNDLWKTAPERANGLYQGIDASDNRNTTRIRVGAGNGDSSVVADKAIADAFGDRFFTPLVFELLESHMSFYQSALGEGSRISSQLMFNDYNRVIQATGDVDASYRI